MSHSSKTSFRIGHGFDAHRLVDKRKLILGGVTIPYEKGLEAHSDGDAVIHAICDALLGAASLGDMGKFFPDTSADFKNKDSRYFLQTVYKMLQEKKFTIANIDVTIVAEAPKLASHIAAMQTILATTMQIDIGQINIKATTTEKMGFTGRGEGIAVYAVALISL